MNKDKILKTDDKFCKDCWDNQKGNGWCVKHKILKKIYEKYPDGVYKWMAWKDVNSWDGFIGDHDQREWIKTLISTAIADTRKEAELAEHTRMAIENVVNADKAYERGRSDAIKEINKLNRLK